MTPASEKASTALKDDEIPCRVCGRALTVQATGPGEWVLGCSADRSAHYDESRTEFGSHAQALQYALEMTILRLRESSEASLTPGRTACKEIIHFGRGHQSKGKCDVEGPHKQHHFEAEPGREYFWRGKAAFSGYFDESPEDQDPTALRRTVVWKGTGTQEGKA